MKPLAFTLALSFACLLPMTAQAADESISFSANYVKEKSTLEFAGELSGFPDGTWIEIRFARKGNDQHIDWYRALVQKQRFKGKTPTLPAEAPPGTYIVEYWLKLSRQPRSIKRWFQLNRGYPGNHQEILETVEVQVGNSEEQQKFIEDCKTHLRGELEEITVIYAAIKDDFDNAKIPEKAEDAAKKYEDSIGEYRKLVKGHWKWVRDHLALPLETERDALETLLRAVSSLYSKAKQDEEDPEELPHIIARWERHVKILKPAIQPYKPILPAAPEKKADEKKADKEEKKG